MPVRIYDISLKLGLNNKAVIAKAKSLGIAAAKVPSSSLDKVSAEYLEEHLCKDHPEIAARLAAPKPVTPVISPESKKRILSAPPPTGQSHQAPALAVAQWALPTPGLSFDTEPKSLRFEKEVRKFLDQQIPHATLSNILIFNAARARFEEEVKIKEL